MICTVALVSYRCCIIQYMFMTRHNFKHTSGEKQAVMAEADEKTQENWPKWQRTWQMFSILHYKMCAISGKFALIESHVSQYTFRSFGYSVHRLAVTWPKLYICQTGILHYCIVNKYSQAESVFDWVLLNGLKTIVSKIFCLIFCDFCFSEFTNRLRFYSFFLNSQWAKRKYDCSRGNRFTRKMCVWSYIPSHMSKQIRAPVRFHKNRTRVARVIIIRSLAISSILFYCMLLSFRFFFIMCQFMCSFDSYISVYLFFNCKG